MDGAFLNILNVAADLLIEIFFFHLLCLWFELIPHSKLLSTHFQCRRWILVILITWILRSGVLAYDWGDFIQAAILTVYALAHIRGLSSYTLTIDYVLLLFHDLILILAVTVPSVWAVFPLGVQTWVLGFLLLIHREVQKAATSRGEEWVWEFTILVPNRWDLWCVLLVSLLLHPLQFGQVGDVIPADVLLLPAVVAT